jgi:DNA-binding transcriptional regulator YiaG
MKPEHMKTWRLANDMTQPEMAEHIGIPFSTYRNWEMGVRKPGKTGIRLMELVKRAEVFCPGILEG